MAGPDRIVRSLEAIGEPVSPDALRARGAIPMAAELLRNALERLVGEGRVQRVDGGLYAHASWTTPGERCHGTPWSDTEDALLLRYAQGGASRRAMHADLASKGFPRTETAIKARLAVLRKQRAEEKPVPSTTQEKQTDKPQPDPYEDPELMAMRRIIAALNALDKALDNDQEAAKAQRRVLAYVNERYGPHLANTQGT